MLPVNERMARLRFVFPSNGSPAQAPDEGISTAGEPATPWAAAEEPIAPAVACDVAPADDAPAIAEPATQETPPEARSLAPPPLPAGFATTVEAELPSSPLEPPHAEVDVA